MHFFSAGRGEAVRKKRLGVLSVLGASIMWAIEPILAKLSFRSTDYLNTFASRTVFCLLVLFLYVLISDIKNFRVEKRHISKLIYISVVNILIADLLYIYALTRVAVINAVLIGHMQPIFVVLFGFILLKEDRIVKYDYWGIVFMIIAGVLVTTKTMVNLISLRFGSSGDLLVLLATFAWATTTIVARKYLQELPAGVIAFYRFFFAGVIFIFYILITRGIVINSGYQVFLGVIIGVGTILYYEGIRLIKAAQVSALELSTPFFATILGIFVLREYITFFQLIGIMFLLGGIYFLSRKE